MAWLTGYSYRKQITIDHTKVSADLSYFPVVVQLTNDTDIGSHALATGYDIRFTLNDNSTLLDYERETFVIDAGSCTANFWVRIPSLSSTVDTTIYLYYGNADALDGENKTGVWDTNYKGVWHLKETGNGINGDFKDSTSNNNNSTNTANQPSRTTGKIGYGQAFDNTDLITVEPDSSLQVQSFTVSAWIQPNTLPASSSMIIVSESDAITSSGIEFGIRLENSETVLCFAYNDGGIRGWYLGSYVLSTNLYYITFTWTPGSLKIYINGSQDGSAISTTSGSIVYNSDTFRIGYQPNGNQYFQGFIDEVRISNIARSSEWISTEYANQNDPGTFCTIDAEDFSFNSEWTGKDTYTVNNHPGAGYQVLFPISWKDGMNADFSDLRFSDDAGNVISYWVESQTNENSARVWIKLTASTTINVHYGNASATSESSINNTMEFGDEFTGTSLDASKWYGSVTSVSGGIASLVCPIKAYSKVSFGTGHEIITRAKSTIVGQNSLTLLGFGDVYVVTGVSISCYQDSPTIDLATSDGTVTMTPSAVNWTPAAYHNFRLYYAAIPQLIIDNGSPVSTSATVPNETFHIFLQTEMSDCSLDVDYIAVRKFNGTEPNFTLVSSTGFIQKIFSSSSNIEFSSTFGSANDLLISKPFASTNDLVSFLSKIFEPSSDILVSKEFVSSSDLIEIITKIFESTSEILSSAEIQSSTNIRFSKRFSSSNDIIVYTETIDYDFPLIIHVSQNTRTVTVSKIKRRVAVATNERTVRVDQ